MKSTTAKIPAALFQLLCTLNQHDREIILSRLAPAK